LRDKERGRGTSKIYPVNADLAWKIAKMVLRWKGMDPIEEHPSEGYMLTSSRESTISWEVFVGAWIEPIDIDNTKVTVITKKSNPADFSFTALNETTFHEEFAAEVERFRQGKPSLVAPQRPATSAPAAPPLGAKTVAVTWTFANVRSGPGNDYPFVTTVKQGDKLTVLGEYEEWFHVRLQDGKEGWIKSGVVK
jgi:hypothetical protein